MQLGMWEIGLLAVAVLIGVSSLASLIKRRQDRLIEDLRQQVQQERDRRRAAELKAKKKAKKKAERRRPAA